MIIDMLIGQLGLGPKEEREVEEKPRAPVGFYVHFDKKTLALQSVSTKQAPADTSHSLLIDSELGRAFILGTDSMMNYAVLALKNDKFELCKRADMDAIISNRVDVVSTIYEVGAPSPIKEADIQLIMNTQEDLVEIYYNGNQIKTLPKPVKMYFTRFNDPSFLKCTFSLDVNILNSITEKNELDEWPNPIRLKLDNVQDMSVYGVKGQLPISASIKHGKVRTK